MDGTRAGHYNLEEFKHDVHVMVCAVVTQLLMILPGIKTATWDDIKNAALNLFIIGLIAFGKTWLSDNRPEGYTPEREAPTSQRSPGGSESDAPKDQPGRTGS